MIWNFMKFYDFKSSGASLSAGLYRADDFLSRLFCFLDYVRVMPHWFFWIFKINAGEKGRMSVFLFSSASFLSTAPNRK